MKQLNFLSKSSSQSCSHSSVTLASTVGSPSAHRRGSMLKLLSVLVLILTIGVGNVWGDPATSNFTNNSLGVGTGEPTWNTTVNATGFESSSYARGVTWGSGKDPVLTSSSITGTITKVSIVASTNAGTSKVSLSVSVGGTAFSPASQYVSSGTASCNQSYEFTGSATGTVSVSLTNTVSDKTAWIKSITITYIAADPATIYLNAEGGTCQYNSRTEESAGDGINLPSASPSSSCAGQDWTFAGWAKTAITETTTAPTLYTGNYTPVDGETLHAVYKKTESSGGSSSGSKTFTFSSIASANNWENGVAYTEVEIKPVTIEAQGGGNNGKWYTSGGGSWRAYSGGTISISVENGSVTSVTSSPSCSFTVSNGTASFSPSARTDFTSITVNYTATGASVTTYNSNPSCCTPLASINGSVSLIQETTGANAGKLTASWPAQGDKTGWADNGLIVKIYEDGNNTPVHTSSAISKNDLSYTATTFDPVYCTTYYATLTPVKADNTYCEGVESTEHTSVTTKGQYTYSVVSATGVQLKSGENEETDNCSDFSAIYVVTGTSQLNLTEVAVTNVASGGYTWNAETGALTIDKTKVNGNVEITITGHAPSVPTVVATSVSFDAVDQGTTVPSSTTFTITGEHLTGNLSMTAAQDSDPFTWSITDGNLTKDANDEVHATVTVTPKSGITETAGTKQASITISGGGASDVVVPISLTVQPRYTVSFSTGEGNDPIEPIKEETYDAGITLPSGLTPTCNDWTFVGWATAEVGSKTSTAPAQLFNGSYKPTEDITLYAVYSKAESGATEEAIASVTISTYASAHSWTGNGSPQVGEIPLNSDITATTNTNGNNGKYYTDWRFYQSDGGALTLTAATGCTLKKATITYGTSDGGVLLDGETTINTGEEYTITGSLSSKSFEVGNSGSANNGKVKITAISVKYDKPATTTYYWSEPVCCTDKVTITKGENPANGTFTIDKDGNQSTCEAAVTVIVTPTPGEHCRVNTVSATTGETGVDNGDGTWTITYAQNTNAASTINVTFVTKTQYTVTWNVNGNESTKTDVYDGEQPVFPETPESCDDAGGSEAFYGWATAAWTGKKALNETGATIYTSANSMPAVTGAVTYYAVFAKATGGGSTPNEQIMNENSPLDPNSNWQDDQDRNNGIQSYAGKSSFQMYGETTNSYPCELTSKIKFNNITGISMNVAANNANTVYLYYSADGENWITWENTVSVSTNTSSYTDYAFDLAEFPTGSYYICLSNSKSSLYMYSVTITSESEPEYSQFMTTCCTKHEVNIANGITNGTVTASPASACEGATVTLTFAPNQSHHLSAWTLGGVEQDLAVNTFTMPAADVTVSATFVHDDCVNLAAPTLDGTVAVTYNSATINWNTVTNASSYDVTVIRHEDSEPIFSGNVNALTKALAELDAETRYDYSIMAVGDGTDFCATGNGLLQGNFTTSELPTAHLTLNDANGTHTSSGDYTILTPFNLPDEAASCSKTFIGWDSDEDCTTAPDYAKGASFTFANTTGVTLYAVYADVTGGGTSTTNIAYSGSTTGNMVEGNNAETLGLDPDEWSVVPDKGENANYPGLNSAHDIRLYYAAAGGNTLTITAPQTITSVGLTFTDPGYSNAWVKVGGEAVELSDGVYPINATSFVIGNANTSNTQVRISNIAVNFNVPGTPSNYSTACLAAPEATPSVDNLNNVDAAGASGTITMAYENVNTGAVSVGLFSNEACTEAFSGEWLTASLNSDKNITYTIAENTSYNDARSAYIKLTAPETNGATDPAIVKIPVSQVKKAAVFASLQDLVAADVNSGTTVTVSFSDVIIDSKVSNGIYFAIQKENANIEIYYASETVPASWQAGGSVSGTMTCQWKRFVQSNVFKCWELQPANNSWAWESEDPNIGLTYAAPKTVESIAIKAGSEPSQKTYAEGATLNPTGMTVTFNYTDKTSKDITSTDPEWANIEWTFDPETLSEGTDVTVSVTAEYNDISSAAFNVTGITVTGIPTLTTQQFIAAGGTRCYLEGVMSNVATGNAYKYGNFDLTDESGSIYVYGCLTADGEAEKFGTIGIGNCDKVKVLAENYTYYNKHEAVNVRYVEKLAQSAASVSLDEDAKEIRVGQSFTLTETVLPCGADNKSVTWTSSDNAIATVENGVVTAVSAGNAIITVTTVDGGYTATCDVTVKPVFNVTYNTSGSTGTTPVDANTYVEDDEVTLLSASGLSNAGYFFDKWVATYVDGNSDIRILDIEDNKFTMPAFDVTVTATWARKSSDKWIKVTEVSQLVADKEYIIVNAEATYAVGEQKTNNRAGAEVEENNDIVTISDAVSILTLGIPESGKYTFQDGDAYLCAASSGSNLLKTQTTLDDNGKWTIEIDGDGLATITATGSYSRKLMRYNPNNGSPIFACYATNSSTGTLVTIYYKAPKIDINNGQTVNVSDAEGADIVVHNGGTLNVNAAKSIGDLTVEAGGKVVLDANKLTVVGTFIIESTMASGNSGQLTGATASNFAANGDAYIDITLGANGTNQQWHAFTVPFPVDAINGIYDLDGNKLVNETNYAIMEYLGDVRATGAYGWKKIRTTLVPGTFYIMATDGYRTTYRFKKKAGEPIVATNSKAYYEYASSTGNNDNGWNGIGNPNLFYGKVGLAVQVLDPSSYTYVTKTANSTNFVVGTPFFYQADGNGSMVMATANAGANYAPARVQTTEIKDLPVAFGNEDFTDYLYVSANEDALNQYETGKDLAKMTMTNTPKVAQIFGKAYNTKLCMVHTPLVNNQAEVALELYAPNTGEYTISAPAIEGYEVYLTREGAIIWNLSMSPYEAELLKGTTNEYGLKIVAAPQVITDIEQSTISDQPSVQKVIIDDKVFILRGEQLFDVTGKTIR